MDIFDGVTHNRGVAKEVGGFSGFAESQGVAGVAEINIGVPKAKWRRGALVGVLRAG